MISVRITKPIRNSSIITDYSAPVVPSVDEELLAAKQLLAMQQQHLAELGAVMEAINSKLSDSYEKFINGHNEEIAKLSVEIARRILASKIDQNDYRIEGVIKQTLSEMPNQNDIEIHLNPLDLEILRQLIDDDAQHPLALHTMVADLNIGKAECEIIGPRGKVRSMINQKLEHIEELLKKA